MPTVLEIYRKVLQALMEAEIEEADAEARLIVADGLGFSLGEIFLKAEMQTEFDPYEIVRKRLSGMPLAYAMNKKYFMGFPFYVDESVLIPRQDTETLVGEALSLIDRNGYETVLDLCCGSGCVGIAIEKLSRARVTGSDVKADAVVIANKNATLLEAERYRAQVSDLFNGIDSGYDLIVCNPPYVTDAEYEVLDSQVRDFEPKDALVGNLDYYEKIAAQAAGYMNPGGALAFEIGCGQKDEVAFILQKNKFLNIKCHKDIAGRHRVMVCTIN